MAYLILAAALRLMEVGISARPKFADDGIGWEAWVFKSGSDSGQKCSMTSKAGATLDAVAAKANDVMEKISAAKKDAAEAKESEAAEAKEGETAEAKEGAAEAKEGAAEAKEGVAEADEGAAEADEGALEIVT
ncbi:unnamed protein product [Prorocentrum cordatum]|uniref:Uncharacterized protein n=1 Tax=Prorocentrum cordatum TaxID=2364126 RepID=A0ABN9XY79_9DINO|nr:unnamed protein product [Polarella glacialis]